MLTQRHDTQFRVAGAGEVAYRAAIPLLCCAVCCNNEHLQQKNETPVRRTLNPLILSPGGDKPRAEQLTSKVKLFL